jgi:hypothetical protein
MRTTIIFLILALCSVSVRAVDLTLAIDHRMQGGVLQAGITYAMDNGTWYFKPRFMKYYLAEITVIHDGGKRTRLSDVYVLVDALGQNRYSLGSYDVTNIEANEGDEVIIFGKQKSISQLAIEMNTIPYEVLTGISRRVKRVYYKET